MASTFQIYSTDNALFTTIDKNKTLVYGWGDNRCGQLGLNEEGRDEGIMECPTPTLLDTVLDFNFKRATCGSNHTALLEENGNLIAFGAN